MDAMVTPTSRDPRTHLLPRQVALALSEQTPAIDSGSLLKHLMDIWGGPAALAASIHAEFQRAPAGGMVRKHIIELIQRLLIYNTQSGIDQVVRPADLDDAQLDDLVLYYMKRLTGPDDSREPSEGTDRVDPDAVVLDSTPVGTSRRRSGGGESTPS
jgi:hypothetical protein